MSDDVSTFLALPFATQAAVICISACFASTVCWLLLLPRRNCFFLRWNPEGRLLALLAAPALAILWPLALVCWLMRRGIIPDDPDFYDE